MSDYTDNIACNPLCPDEDQGSDMHGRALGRRWPELIPPSSYLGTHATKVATIIIITALHHQHHHHHQLWGRTGEQSLRNTVDFCVASNVTV